MLWVIHYWADGTTLRLDQRTIGPFATYEEACDHLPLFPPPVNGGHKYVAMLDDPTDYVSVGTAAFVHEITDTLH